MIVINNETVIRALSHKEPFIMIDELVYIDEDKTIAKLHITEGNIFSKDGFFQEPGIIEHVAQSAALRPTIERMQSKNTAPIGFFAGVKRFKLYKLPEVNQSIETTVVNIVVV